MHFRVLLALVVLFLVAFLLLAPAPELILYQE
jgi:hypothetical protein